jgi:hypothetical protein
MLQDEGLQYNFISYADVVEKGIPDRYKVLILPAVLCLSDVEAARIRDFCRNGGTVIADYLPACGTSTDGDEAPAASSTTCSASDTTRP